MNSSNLKNSITVVIAAYNSEKYIEECLNSLSIQTDPDFEVIIIDDGSKDNTKSICNKFISNDIRFKYFFKPNSGVSSARNLGIEKSQSEWILFLDSDDYVSQNFILNHRKNIERAERGDIIFCGFYRVDSTGKLISTSKGDKHHFGLDEKGEAIEYLHIKNDLLGYICSKIFNLETIKLFNIRFNSDISLSEDLCFTLDYIKVCKDIYTTEMCEYYYRTDNSSSLTKKKHDYNSVKKAINISKELFYSICKNSDCWKEVNLKITDSMFCNLVSLIENHSTKYTKEFIIKEIDDYKKNDCVWKVHFSSAMYRFINMYILTHPATLSFFFLKQYFRIKGIKNGKLE